MKDVLQIDEHRIEHGSLSAIEAERYAAHVSNTAYQALLLEVSATPKPGLVDAAGSGAHSDMDIRTFENSAKALLPYFRMFTRFGIEHAEEDPAGFLKRIRGIGIAAEKAMLEATGGVNTHKGAIFSMGIVTTAYGYCCMTGADLRTVIKAIGEPAMDDFRHLNKETAVTAGQQLYLQYGIAGARGEAADGYETVFVHALPKMRDLIKRGYSTNDAGLLSLIAIMAQLIDTNIIHRGGYEAGVEIRERMEALNAMPAEDTDYISILEAMDREFIARHLSPGGSADLLAMTYFIMMMEEEV